jgi:hypothetical protein
MLLVLCSFFILCSLPPSRPPFKVHQIAIGRGWGSRLQAGQIVPVPFVLPPKFSVNAKDTFPVTRELSHKDKMFSSLGQINDLWNLQCKMLLKGCRVTHALWQLEIYSDLRLTTVNSMRVEGGALLFAFVSLAINEMPGIVNTQWIVLESMNEEHIL